MSNKMICPVCGKQMKIGMLDPDDSMGTVWMSIMPCDCVCSYGASKAVWQALIQAKQDLGIARQALEWLGNNRLAENPVRVEQLRRYARKALEQITHDNSEKTNSVEHKE